jgi:hypothetical protein
MNRVIKILLIIRSLSLRYQNDGNLKNENIDNSISRCLRILGIFPFEYFVFFVRNFPCQTLKITKVSLVVMGS